MNPNDEKNLETLIHQTLRSLPERQAPSTLEHRVFNALAARKALPWWRQSFTHWPAPARLGFAGGSLVLVAGLLLSGSIDTARLSHAFSTVCTCLAPLRATIGVLGYIGNLGAHLFHSIPAAYLYGGTAAIVMFYVVLFGLGTTAYRTFFANR